MMTARKRKRIFFARIKKAATMVLVFGFPILLVLLILFGVWYFLQYSYTIISPLPNSVLGKSISSTDSPLLQNLKTNLKNKGISFSQITPSDSSYVVTLEGGEEILFSKQKKIDEQVSSLQLVLSRLTIEGKRLKSLDFRFDKPVVTFYHD